MLLQEFRVTGREFNFRITIQFITLREKSTLLRKLMGKKKKYAKLKIVDLL